MGVEVARKGGRRGTGDQSLLWLLVHCWLLLLFAEVDVESSVRAAKVGSMNEAVAGWKTSRSDDVGNTVVCGAAEVEGGGDGGSDEGKESTEVKDLGKDEGVRGASMLSRSACNVVDGGVGAQLLYVLHGAAPGSTSNVLPSISSSDESLSYTGISMASRIEARLVENSSSPSAPSSWSTSSNSMSSHSYRSSDAPRMMSSIKESSSLSPSSPSSSSPR